MDICTCRPISRSRIYINTLQVRHSATTLQSSCTICIYKLFADTQKKKTNNRVYLVVNRASHLTKEANKAIAFMHLIGHR